MTGFFLSEINYGTWYYMTHRPAPVLRPGVGNPCYFVVGKTNTVTGTSAITPFSVAKHKVKDRCGIWLVSKLLKACASGVSINTLLLLTLEIFIC